MKEDLKMRKDLLLISQLYKKFPSVYIPTNFCLKINSFERNILK